MMMRNSRALYAATVLVTLFGVSLVLTACGGQLSGGGGEGESAQATKLGFVPKALNQEFWLTAESGAKAADEELPDAQVIVNAGPTELAVDDQIAIVEDMLTRQVGALCIAPTAPEQLHPVLTRASEQMPVLLVDTDIPGWDGKTTYIGTDNFKGGQEAGKYIVEQLGGSGTLAIIGGIPGATSGEQRVAGVKDVVEGTDIEVVQEVAADFDRAEAVGAMADILQTNPDVDAVFAANDQMALGALEALQSRGLNKDVLLVGYDGTEEAALAVRDAKGIDATVAQNPFEMGKVCVEKAAAAAAGEDIEPKINTRVTLVTSENAETYLQEYRERLGEGTQQEGTQN